MALSPRCACRPGDRLWMPHDTYVWIPSTVEKIDGAAVTFTLGNPTSGELDGPSIITGNTKDLHKYEPVEDQQLEGLDDICSLPAVPEAAILHAVRVRYSRKLIYTRVARILITVNPFTPLPCYSMQHVDEYKQCEDSALLPPHIFGLGHDAIRGLRAGEPNHVVLISGESGAGKTESAKLMLSYITHAVRSEGNIENKVLQTSPIFEAFGNAMTVRNSNSSRFGKWLDLHFNSSIEIQGCQLTQYLLEKTRVCSQSPQERGYHIFFQLIRGISKGCESPRMPRMAKRKQLKLKNPEDYRYLQAGQQFAPGVDDVERFGNTLDAFASVGFEMDTQFEIFRILSAILLLGNCDFIDAGDDTTLKDATVGEHVAELLGIDAVDLTKCMVSKQMVVGSETLTKQLKPETAATIRDGLARLLYGRLFEWLVTSMNRALYGNEHCTNQRTLGVLDIAGFESFDKNSLEQLLINLSNEHLQQSFNDTIFIFELEEMKKEGIAPEQNITFADNSNVLMLINGRGGILDLLDQSVQLGSGSDESFASSVATAHKKHSRLILPTHPKPIFGIKHFAGEVQYTVEGFLEKNADKPPDGSMELFNSSSLAVLRELGGGANLSFSAARGSARKAPTIASGFKSSMKSLLAKIETAQRHYIRCIKPNHDKAPFKFVSKVSMEQLLFSGILDAVRMRQIQFAARIPLSQFVTKYGWLVDKPRPASIPLPEGQNEAKKCVNKLVQAMRKKMGSDKLPPGTVVVGHTKVLIKSDSLQVLNDARSHGLHGIATMLQRAARSFSARKMFKRLREHDQRFREWLTTMGASPPNSMPSGSMITHFGSEAAVEDALAVARGILQEAVAARIQNVTVNLVKQIENRLKQETDVLAELVTLKDSGDPMAIKRLLGRSGRLGLAKTGAHLTLKDHLDKLIAQLPLEQARASEFEIDVPLECVLDHESPAPPTTVEMEQNVASTLEVSKLASAQLGQEGQRNTVTDVLTGRRTVTRIAPYAQFALLKKPQEAKDNFSSEEAEGYLGEAVVQDISMEGLVAARIAHLNFQNEVHLMAKTGSQKSEVHLMAKTGSQKSEVHLMAKTGSQKRQADDPNTEERTTNMQEQIARLIGDKETFSEEEEEDGLVGLDDFDLVRYPGLKSTATWKCHRKSVIAQSRQEEGTVDGKWKKAVIEGNELRWNDGSVSKLERISKTEIRVHWEGEELVGMLCANGQLVWSDGDLWVRPPQEPTTSSRIMLSHTNGDIDEALTYINPGEEELAVQNFQNILCYMTDKPANDLVRQASFDSIISLAKRRGLSNEVFIQVMKQLTNNPSPPSNDLGWHLLLLICQSVLPGEDLLPYVRMFLTKITTGSDGDASSLATNCLQALEMRTLPVLRGHLWKKKPQTIKLKGYDKRFFVIGNHHLFWWATKEDSARPESARPRGGPLCKGVIDFSAEEVEVENVGDSMFVLKPKNGAWSRSFKHAAGDPNRIYTFDTNGTEHSRDTWTNTIQAHLDYSERFRITQSLSTMNRVESNRSVRKHELVPPTHCISRWLSWADMM